MQDHPIPKKNSDPRNQLSGSHDIDKLTQRVLDMKAEMGSMRKAMIRSGNSFDNVPNDQKQKERKTEEQLHWKGQEEEQEGQGDPTFSRGSRREGQCF